MKDKKIMENKLLNELPFKLEYDDVVVDCEIADENDKRIAELDSQIEELNKKLAKKERKKELLTCEADKIDYIVAASVGLLTGIIDAVFVDDLDLRKCREIGDVQVESLVKKLGHNNDLSKAVKNLEKNKMNSLASDSNLADFGGGNQHHLRDFAHHPTLAGLLFSLLGQITGNAYGTDTSGSFIVKEVVDKGKIGGTFIQKITFGTIGWFIHLASDVAGTSKSAGRGSGIPGPILSLAKELSSTPLFKNAKSDDMSFSLFLSKLYNGTLFAEHKENGKINPDTVLGFDLRTEIGMITRQAIPVLINVAMVRVFYSIRRFIQEIREKQIKKFKDIFDLDWRKIAPYGNKTVNRMVTLSIGSFEIIDLSAALIKGAIKSKGSKIEFAKQLILNVNFVGAYKMCICIKKEVVDIVRLYSVEKSINDILNKKLSLENAKLYYKTNNVWNEVVVTEKGIEELKEEFNEYIYTFSNQLVLIDNNLASSTEKIEMIKNDSFNEKMRKAMGVSYGKPKE